MAAKAFLLGVADSTENCDDLDHFKDNLDHENVGLHIEHRLVGVKAKEVDSSRGSVKQEVTHEDGQEEDKDLEDCLESRVEHILDLLTLHALAVHIGARGTVGPLLAEIS